MDGLYHETGRFVPAWPLSPLQGDGQQWLSSAYSGVTEPPMCMLSDVENTGPVLDLALSALESTLVNLGIRAQLDSSARARYGRMVSAISGEYRSLVHRGAMTAEEAAQAAYAQRIVIRDAIRKQSSDIGRAFAHMKKPDAGTFNTYVEKYAQKTFRKSAGSLTQAEATKVFKALIEGSGRPNQSIMNLGRRLGYLGRGFFVIAAGLAVYEIATSNDPVASATKVGTVTVAGLGGSIATGAAAGLVCGPGAPVCVGIGAFIGGVVFAIGADVAVDWW